MAGLVVAVVGATVLGFTVSGRAATTAFAVLLAVCALLRGIAPETVVPPARSRTFDVAFLLVLALALAYLAPWGNATLPGKG